MMLSIIILLLGMILASSDELLDLWESTRPFNVAEEAVYSTAYLLYLSSWLFGNNKFLQDMIRLDENRKNTIIGINRNINYLVFILVFLSLFTAIRLFLPNIQDQSDLYYTVIELFFGVASQLSIVIFIYFIFSLNRERRENRSKLSKARLELIIYSILVQIIMSVIILVGIIFLLGIPSGNYNSSTIESIMLLGMICMTIVTCIIIISSLTIPEWIRKRYDIGKNRFDPVKKLKSYET